MLLLIYRRCFNASWGVVVDSIQAPAEGTGGSPVSVNSDEPKSPQRAAATVAAAGGRDGKKKLRQGAAGSKYTPVKKRGKQSSSPMLLKAAGGAAREAGKQPKNSSCCSSNSMRAAAAAPLNSLLNLTTVSNLSTEKNSLSTDSIEAVAASADAAVDGGKASANGQAKRVFSRSRAAAAAGANSLMAIL